MPGHRMPQVSTQTITLEIMRMSEAAHCRVHRRRVEGQPRSGRLGRDHRHAGRARHRAGGGAATTTNNKMELTGAIEALSRCRARAAPCRSTPTRPTSSRASASGCTAGSVAAGRRRPADRRAEPRFVGAAGRRSSSARGPRAIAWHYVRGHVGIPGNERVDEIADSFACRSPSRLYDGPLSGYPVPILDLPDDTTVPRAQQALVSAEAIARRPPIHISASSMASRCAMRRGASASSA